MNKKINTIKKGEQIEDRFIKGEKKARDKSSRHLKENQIAKQDERN